MNRADKRRQKKLTEKAAKKTNALNTRSLAVQDSIDISVQYLSAGDLPKAEEYCRQALQTDPDQPIALHLLGVIAHQRGNYLQAVEHLTRSISINADDAEAHFNLGNTLLVSGHHAKAAESFKKAIVLKSDFAQAHSSLGNALNQLGRQEDAVASYQRATAIKPDYVESHFNLGVALHALGQLEAAATSFRKALSITPDDAEIHNNLGSVYYDLGNLDDAVKSCQAAIAINPDYDIAHNNLGGYLNDLGKLKEAAESYRRALAINPEFAEAHNNLGNVYSEWGNMDDALSSYQSALAIKPEYADAYNNIGNAYTTLHRLDEAIENYEKTLTINPDHAEAHYNLGLALLEQGELDEAAANFRKALTIKPGYAEAHRNLVGIERPDVDEDVRSMEDAYKQTSSNEQDRMHLAFGLGKAFEGLHDYEKAFDYLAEGNRIKRGTFSYSIDEDLDFFKNTMTAFEPSLFAKYQGEGCDHELPIFILGMPRSGSTLVEQILASHPHVHGAGELDNLQQILSSCFDINNEETYPDNIQEIGGIQLKRSGQEYIKAIKGLAPDSRFIVNKMLDNYKYIGLIKLILPNAKVIHCKRDPVDTCFSIFKNYFVGTHPYAYDLVELGQYYKLYSRLMDHWYQVIPDFIYDIEYEEMISDQAGQTKALLDYCGLEWDDACLEFYKLDRPVKTVSSAQVRKPIYADSVQLWKHYEKQLAPLLDVLNN